MLDLFGNEVTPKTRCRITLEDGGLALTSPYLPALVQAVKSLPYAERRWDGNRKVWIIDPKHGQELVKWIRDFAHEMVVLPDLSVKSSTPVMQILEVRYIGACKTREDGSSAAFGLVGKDWSLIFPESVLRTWFDSGEAEPGEAQTLYQILAVKKTATPNEIKSAFRRMAMQWHPDVCREPNAAEIFIRIKEAHDILSSEGMRARYDAGLAWQASLEKSRQKNRWVDLLSTAYRSPLRCGLILLEGTPKVGRIEVSKILKWDDIVKNCRTLVVSWPMGAKEPVEQWV